MNKHLTLGTLLLAAGSSQRFGSDKRRHSLDGQPLLERSLALALAMRIPCQLVLRTSDRLELPNLLGDSRSDPLLRICYTDEAELGMGHSLACGARHLLPLDGIIILLADMPWLQSETLELMAARFDGKHILVPCYLGQRGHPVVFPRDLFDELRQLTGDQGGRALLAQHRERVREVDVTDPGILRDLDYPPTP